MREIYALPKKGGGIIPTVSIDGWMHLANAHPAFDGLEFESEFDGDGKIVSTTCILHRNDRTHPIRLTELFSECYRDTESWKAMPNRMLRHKAAIQATRYTFGFAGIYDEDEAARFTQPPAISAMRANHTRAEAASPGARATGFPTGEHHEHLVAPYIDTSSNAAVAAPEKPIAEMTTDEAGARLNEILDERTEHLEDLKREAEDTSKCGFKLFSDWAKRLHQPDADLLAPFMDSYRQSAINADNH
jgi:hypothetical protein